MEKTIFNHQMLHDLEKSCILTLNFPILTAERYAQFNGSPIGVVENQIDHNELPILQIGKRRFVNVEDLRQTAGFEAAHVPAR